MASETQKPSISQVDVEKDKRPGYIRTDTVTTFNSNNEIIILKVPVFKGADGKEVFGLI